MARSRHRRRILLPAKVPGSTSDIACVGPAHPKRGAGGACTVSARTAEAPDVEWKS